MSWRMVFSTRMRAESRREVSRRVAMVRREDLEREDSLVCRWRRREMLSFRVVLSLLWGGGG